MDRLKFMPKFLRFGPRALVIAPLVVLSALFVLALGLLVGANLVSYEEHGSLLAISAAVYFGAVFMLYHAGMVGLAKVQKITFSDPLTALPNRRALQSAIVKTAGNGEVALALVDLDGFKQVNENFNHAFGDEVLKKIAVIMKKVCGDDATIFRLGGDEFTILLSGPLAGTILEGLCRKIIEQLTYPIPVEERRIPVGASIGIARGGESDNLSLSELLRRADVAMDASKRAGKGRCTWFNPAFDKSREAVRVMDDELRDALARSEFALNYQPLVDAQSKEVVAVEALIRWNRPDGKAVGPNIFIPVAEETGLINAIGIWVVRKACEDALKWDNIKLSINISAAQLRNPEFPVQLGHILEDIGFPPSRLELEVTETCLVLDPVVAERTLEVIRGFGVNVALDDFGTGYASIGFLRQFRFEKLKLDRSLVTRAESDAGSRAMMLSSITVARAMNMGITAEGVETQEQADMVRAAGCDQIQGWLYFKAMPAEDITRLLSKSGDDLLQSAEKRA